jgi:hypothetical protein
MRGAEGSVVVVVAALVAAAAGSLACLSPPSEAVSTPYPPCKQWLAAVKVGAGFVLS